MRRKADRSARSRATIRTVFAICTTALCVAPVFAAHIEAKPEAITFHSPTQTVVVHLMRDGQPLPAEEMGTVKLMINDHDYDHMINVQRTDGALLITPTDQLETGTYELYVGAPKHRIKIPMEAPLETIPSSLELMAAAHNTTLEEMKVAMGLVTTSPRQNVYFDLPEQYYLGQELRIQMAPPPDRKYEWRVNGVPAAIGYGPHTFRYTFYDMGTYFISYTETLNGEQVAHVAQLTRAIEEPAVEWQVATNQEFRLKGPDGFAQYAWSVDGKLFSIAPEVSLTFEKPGERNVECFAVTPGLYGANDEFRKITYEIDVERPAGD